MNSSQRPRNRDVGRAMAALEDKQAGRKTPQLAKQSQYKYHDWRDKWFRTEQGDIVIAQQPNIWLLVFVVVGFFAVVSYHGFWHGTAQIVALLSILIWGYLEQKTGVNRFRRLLGKIALVCVVIVLILYFWK